jgi:phospholipid/cholesterol/gamma-HCH transport system ATP-binding protein
MNDATDTVNAFEVIRIDGLWSSFRTDGVEALIHQDLDLTIRKGELVSIVGGSGSG